MKQNVFSSPNEIQNGVTRTSCEFISTIESLFSRGVVFVSFPQSDVVEVL